MLSLYSLAKDFERMLFAHKDEIITRSFEMSEVVLWTSNHCPMCDRVKDFFGEGNFEERPASGLISGDEHNDEALVQLAMQDMQLPAVKVDGEFVSLNEILDQSDSMAA